MTAPIWLRTPTLDECQDTMKDTIIDYIGIKITEIGPDYIRGTMPAGPRVFQPRQRIHGGANVVLAESLGSLGASLLIDKSQWVCFGQEINANHLRGVSSGLVTGTARPVHIGRSSQVWEIRITDDQDRLSCISRLTMAVVPLREGTPSGGV